MKSAFTFCALLNLSLVGALDSQPAIEAGKGFPLHPERKVEFTTTEGTWLSIDVSHDGKTIVFDLAGRLCTLRWMAESPGKSQVGWLSTASLASRRMTAASRS